MVFLLTDKLVCVCVCVCMCVCVCVCSSSTSSSSSSVFLLHINFRTSVHSIVVSHLKTTLQVYLLLLVSDRYHLF